MLPLLRVQYVDQDKEMKLKKNEIGQNAQFKMAFISYFVGGSSLKIKRAGYLSDTEDLSYTLAGTDGFRESWPHRYW